MPDTPGSSSGFAEQTVAIVGGGFAGSLAALKLSRDTLRPVLIEQHAEAGPGLAYGAAHEAHVLNVPVNRMELGLEPGFADWLQHFPGETVQAVGEAGELAHAFVPRSLYGRYLQGQVEAAVRDDRIRRLRGTVTKIERAGRAYEVSLADGRSLSADIVVLATGNLPPKAPHVTDVKGHQLADCALFHADPWHPDTFAGLAPDAPILLIGTGLTMADVVLSLRRQGHTGQIHALSRHGLLPLPHRAGGAWPAFLHDCVKQSPARIMHRLRIEAAKAVAQGVPWQRVLDAARPHVAQVWAAWSRAERSRFLRLARPYWDVHRHRVAPHVSAALSALREQHRLTGIAGRLTGFSLSGAQVLVSYRPRAQPDRRNLLVARIVNCTGPRSDYAILGAPVFASLRVQGLIHPDHLGLGIETRDVQVIDADGQVSDTLFAIGALTRPAWWEITAVPEIAAQVNRLIEIIKFPIGGRANAYSVQALGPELFEVGAGI